MNFQKSILVAAIGAMLSAPVMAQEVLTGDTRTACEVILCLATGQRPSECNPPIRRYLSIHKRTVEKTIKARIEFLEKCPASQQSPEMKALVKAMGNGAGRCDAASLNSALRTWMGGEEGYSQVSNSMPGYCAAYTNHQYTDLSGYIPVYVGIPSRGGFWTEPANYSRDLAAYNARIAQEDAQRNWGN